MMTAQLITTWIGAGTTENPCRPKVGEDHLLVFCRDVTGQDPQNIPPAPNALVVEAVMEDEVLTAIEADASVIVLWSDAYEPPT